MRYVLDASALVALVLDEPGAARVRACLADSVIGMVNLAEAVGIFAREGMAEGDVRGLVDRLPCPIILPSQQTALAVGRLLPVVRRTGLSLGDRFCLALAAEMKAVALTADRQWTNVADDLRVEVELIR